jgi:hypothetical protein
MVQLHQDLAIPAQFTDPSRSAVAAGGRYFLLCIDKLRRGALGSNSDGGERTLSRKCHE